MKVGIGIVDDNPTVINRIKSDFSQSNKYEIQVEAFSGKSLISALKNSNSLPVLILIDVDMPGYDGIQTLKIMKQNFPDIKGIMFSVLDDDKYLFESLKAGASGYLLKEEAFTRIEHAITETLEYGSMSFSPRMARKVLQHFSEIDRIQKPVVESNLTDRQLDILQHISYGYNAHEIADEMKISYHTVRKHTSNIYEKLNVSSKTEAVKLGLLKKWIK